MQIAIQEQDAMRNLQKLPKNTPLYLYKMRQIQQLSKARVEIEKITQENRFSRLHKQYQNKEVARQQREAQQDYRSNLQRKMENIGYWDQYSPVNGFMILFDFVYVVPKKYYAIALQFKISRNGKIINRGGKVMLHETQKRLNNSNDKICFFEISKQIYDIPNEKGTLLIIQIEGFSLTRDGREIRQIWAWT